MATAAGVKDIFRKFDTNRNSYIERTELISVLLRLDGGDIWNEDKVQEVITAADANKDGMIDYEELINWIFQEGELQEAVFVAAGKVAFPIDDAIVQELTWARTKPAEVAEVLRERLRLFKGKEYFPPERKGDCVVTKEGTAVVEEAIKYCMEQAKNPAGGVGASSELGLAFAGEDHITDIGQVGSASHASSDGSTFSDRIKRYGHFASAAECLWYGSQHSDARAIVLDLIVDDGVASRGHRLGVYNPIYDSVGVAYGPHLTFGMCAALEFAKDYEPYETIIKDRATNGPVQPDPKVVAEARSKVKTAWSLGNCAACKEPIKGGRVVEIEELGKMHADCFACSSCSKQLRGVPYNVHSGALFCRPCHAEKHGEVCVACKKPIGGSMLKCSLGTFHAECVVCSKCSKAIGRDRFSTAGGVITCQACSHGELGAAVAKSAAKSKAKATSAPPKAKAGAKPKAKTKAKVSMDAARSAAHGMAMSYGDLG